jgi:hypothetical protein
LIETDPDDLKKMSKDSTNVLLELANGKVTKFAGEPEN